MAQSVREQEELGMSDDLNSNNTVPPQDLFMDVSQDYCKIKTKYGRENYTDSCKRNNMVQYKVESRDMEATRIRTGLERGRYPLNWRGNGKQIYY
jgi:hypothetical protein